MRASIWIETVPTVISATAVWDHVAPNTVVVDAKVQLNDTCWSNPRFEAPLGRVRAKADASGVAPILVVATYTPHHVCGMVVRQVDVPALHWRIYPNPSLTAVKIVGSAQPVTAPITH
jgi:hypothetical protein